MAESTSYCAKFCTDNLFNKVCKFLQLFF